MPVGTEKELQSSSGAGKIDDRQLVIFKIAGEEFGVDINEVKEIIRWTDVTRIPNTESYIKGVINLRGSIVVVNDLAMKLGLPSKEIDDDTRILVVEVGSNTVGMIVDSATEVLRLDADKVKDAPSMITSGIDSNYIDGVGVLSEDRLLTLLDLAKVMESKDFERILAAQHAAERNIVKQQQIKGASNTEHNQNNASRQVKEEDFEINQDSDAQTKKLDNSDNFNNNKKEKVLQENTEYKSKISKKLQ